MTMRGSITSALVGGPTLQPCGTAVLEFRFGTDDPAFAGHFPSRPLLPGIFQLEMTRLAAELVVGLSLTVREVCRAKFLRPILPEEPVRLELAVTEETESIRARALFSVRGKRVGEAVLCLWRSA
jgi:3-hydroxymyristoyl/3-hydroxydecanoyl-(acyl carrier protein) dehydratase